MGHHSTEYELFDTAFLKGALQFITGSSRLLNFAPSFVREFGITPARYVEQLRLEAARRRLERTEMSLEEIASACGFASAEIMRKAFLRCLGIRPARYRDHFGHPAACTSSNALK